uniref:Uncharacterized protein n=1 Tax=Nicotiana tabacum TaxID=4097 RepID=A0A1S4B2V8_TOBAC|nr:PREDICTED: uncharacterized protein LOC107803976 [Nicotiana tabacum]
MNFLSQIARFWVQKGQLLDEWEPWIDVNQSTPSICPKIVQRLEEFFGFLGRYFEDFEDYIYEKRYKKKKRKQMAGVQISFEFFLREKKEATETDILLALVHFLISGSKRKFWIKFQVEVCGWDSEFLGSIDSVRVGLSQFQFGYSFCSTLLSHFFVFDSEN